MGIIDISLLAVRWIHGMSAVTWVGGSIFYWLIVRPAVGQSDKNTKLFFKIIGQKFRSIVNTLIGVLLITGAVLAANRLTAGSVSVSYAIVLCVKILLAIYMFYIVWFLRRSTNHDGDEVAHKGKRPLGALLVSTDAMLVAGFFVFLLSDILSALFERGLIK